MSISSSDPNQIYNTLEQQTAQLGQEVTSMAQNVDLTDPKQALQFQRATMKYQTLFGTNSGYIDMLKRLLSGIIQKI
ncbi:type III secretion apparatus needle protein [Paraburkholderia sp. Clong3]|uniref:EscF/YscF/HrpA family type III secretion system needle major subunit n=1 Tax=Paraburkholderia sp. Clong3 TaxID=2991061 RepID=UPI003D1C2E03